MNSSAQLIHDIVSRINPHDELEARHKQDVLEWIESGAPLFRITKPDNPPKHLVSYFVLYDKNTGQMMLVDHAKAKAWLPAGGHVDPDEDPRITVVREAEEELDIAADFSTPYGEDPLFITTATTKGYGNHTDVSLWYLIAGDSTRSLTYDPEEMHGYRWFSPEELLKMEISELDPHMHRFVQKLQRHEK